MKKLYLISSLSVLSLSAISAANVKKVNKKISTSRQNCQTTKVAGAKITTCIEGERATSLTRAELSSVQLMISNLVKRQSRVQSSTKAWTSPYPSKPRVDDGFDDGIAVDITSGTSGSNSGTTTTSNSNPSSYYVYYTLYQSYDDTLDVDDLYPYED